MTPPPAARRSPGARSTIVIAAVAGTVAMVIAWIVTRDLFVMTEARDYSLWGPRLDLSRWLLFPVLDWGAGRLLGMLQFIATNRVCGVDAGCFNLVGAAEVAVATAMLVVHTRQLSGSAAIAVAAAALWVTSPALLGGTLWQATRFDLLVFTLVLAATALWWWAGARETFGRWGATGLVAATLVLLNLAFNAKEIGYVLVVLLPLIGVVRGWGRPRGVRRNLLLLIVPLGYAAWFIGHGLAHMTPSYAARVSSQPIVDNLAELARQGLGVDDQAMYLAVTGDAAGALRDAAIAAYLLFGGLLVLLAATVGARTGLRWWRGRRAGVGPAAGPRAALDGLVLRGAPAILLLAVLTGTMAILARNDWPAAYYLLLPAWAGSVLLLLAIRALARATPWPRATAGVLLGAWGAAHLLVLAGWFAVGSAHDQLVRDSLRLRAIGETLRTELAGRPVGPVRWRTLGIPPTELFLLRDPGKDRLPTGQWQVGEELFPYLLLDPVTRREVTFLPEGTVDELLATMPDPGAPGETLIVVDDQYRLRLLRHGGEVLLHDDGPAG